MPLTAEILKINIMYAIVDIAGFQFNVEPGKKIFVHHLEGAEGDKVRFDKVLLTGNDGDVKVGTPVVEGAAVNATILQNVKGDKVIVFKKKRRKGYKKKNGHRQSLTQIQIDEILAAN
jgi:large subunit ribosomal protein L21